MLALTIIAVIVAIAEIPIYLAVSSISRKKDSAISKKQHKESQEERKNMVSSVKTLIGMLKSPSPYTPEEKTVMIGTAQSVLHTIDFSDSGNATLGMTATVESSITPIDRSPGEPEDMGPGRTVK